MYGWHDGGFGILWMVLSWALIAAIVFLIVRAVGGGPSESSSQSSQSARDPRDILAERFARGEISEQEYRERKRVLDESPADRKA